MVEFNLSRGQFRIPMSGPVDETTPLTPSSIDISSRPLKDCVLSAEPFSDDSLETVLNYKLESDLIDFKQDFHDDEREWLEITKDILAFANTFGGYLVFGVANDRRKVGMPQGNATLLADSAKVQAKVNRYIQPKIHGLGSLVVEADGLGGLQYAYIHVPPSRTMTHVVEKTVSWKTKEGRDAPGLREGEVYVRRVGSKGVASPQEFEALLQRRMEQFKVEIFSRVRQVVEAPESAKILIVGPTDAVYGTAGKVRLSSDPDAQPIRGISPTAVPTTSSEELATLIASYRKDKRHAGSSPFFFGLYAERLTLEIPKEQLEWLLSLCVRNRVPYVYWLRQIEPKLAQTVLEELAKSEDNQIAYEAIKALSLIDLRVAQAIANSRLRADPPALAQILNTKKGAESSLFQIGLITPRIEQVRNDRNQLADEASDLARQLCADRGGLPEKWKLAALDAWLYS